MPGQVAFTEQPHNVAIRMPSQCVCKKPLPEDDPLKRCPDITCARKKLDWAPSVSLEEGLKRTLDYFDRLLASETATGN